MRRERFFPTRAFEDQGGGGAKGTRQYSEYTPLHLPLNSKIDDNMSQKIIGREMDVFLQCTTECIAV